MFNPRISAGNNYHGVATVLWASVLLIAAIISPRSTSAEPRGGFETAGSELSTGDRVKVTFFELLDMPAMESENGGAKQPAVHSFYQRLDLSAEYTVQLDGSIAFPRLGAFEVARRPLVDVQSDIAASFERIMGRACEVTISILERQPVYVIGAARNSGAYKHVPGMLVLNAVALAGGLERQAERSGKLIEILREQERHATLVARLKRLLAQKARLEAEQDGLTESGTPRRLIELGGTEEATLLMQTENAILKQMSQDFDEEMRLNAEQVEAAQREINAIENRRAQTMRLVELREKRVSQMTTLAGKGIVSKPNMTLVETDLAEDNTRASESMVLLAQAQQTMQQAQRRKARLARDRASRITRELAVNVDETLRTDRELLSAQRIADVMAMQRPELMIDAEGTMIDYEIVRRMGRLEATTIKADELTPVYPGDIVRIKFVPRSTSAPDLKYRQGKSVTQ